jgi:hypothetical protein
MKTHAFRNIAGFADVECACGVFGFDMKGKEYYRTASATKFNVTTDEGAVDCKNCLRVLTGTMFSNGGSHGKRAHNQAVDPITEFESRFAPGGVKW